MIDKATVARIKDAADIVEVVSDYVHLVRRGANYMGLCPFHNERTPSFSVNRRRNFCYCFSCHKGGSPVNFIMEKEGVSYHDALLQLARKYGIRVEEKELTDEEREAMTLRESMLVANDWAMQHMQKTMRETPEGQDVGLQYFYSRGVTEEAIKEFRLGYSLDSGNDLTEAARRKGFDIQLMRRLGLTGVSQNGREYDRFHGRVIYPILNSSGKPIAFGGRDLKGGAAKYVNSPESELYVKSNELYGIYQAKSEIVRQNRCFLVEGYMDVIGMWQSGMKNVVASSGTALTDGQIALIHRFTENVTLIYDGDAAGIKASLRGVDMLLSHRMKVKVLLLPEGKDPDEFARDHTPAQFQEYVEKNQTDVIRFKAKVLLDAAGDDPQRRSQSIMSVVQSIACIPEDVERNVYVQECSRLFGVEEHVIVAAVTRARGVIVENLRKSRRLKDFDRENGTGSEQSSQTSQPDVVASQEGSTSPAPPINIQARNPLRPLEYRIIENLIRFGFVDFCEAVDRDGNACGMMNVAEYIAGELEADGIVLSDPVFARILALFPGMKEDFLADRDRYMQLKVEEKAEEMRRAGQEEIARKGLSMSEIQREEQKLEDRIADMRMDEYNRFSRDYAGNELASHEDTEIRKIVNGIINDRYRLSNIFFKLNPNAPREEEIEVQVNRALVELKSEILNIEVKKVNDRLAAASESDNTEEVNRLFERLQILLKMRSTVARNIGERILSPR